MPSDILKSLNKKILLSIGALAILLVGAYFLYSHSTSALAQCPDDFATSEESTAAMNAWTNSYFDTHPDASMGDWARARRQFYVDNHCTAALERVQQAEDGKADPETMKVIDKVLQEATSTAQGCTWGVRTYPEGFRAEGAGPGNICLPEPDRPDMDGKCHGNQPVATYECQSGEWTELQ